MEQKKELLGLYGPEDSKYLRRVKERIEDSPTSKKVDVQ